MSPQNALIYVENIRKALVDLDQNADTYNANAKHTVKRLKNWIKSCKRASNIASKPAIHGNA